MIIPTCGLKSKTLKPTKEQIEKLVVKAQKFDEAAFTELFEIFYEPLLGYIARRSDRDDTEDLLSETWLRVVQYLPNYKAQKDASFRAWIFRIAHNKIIDYYRTLKKHLSIDEPSGDEEDAIPYSLQLSGDERENPDQKFASKMALEELRKHIQSLPSLQQEIIELKYLEGFTNTEIAHIVNKSEGNVRVIQLRGLKALREMIEDGQYKE